MSFIVWKPTKDYKHLMEKHEGRVKAIASPSPFMAALENGNRVIYEKSPQLCGAWLLRRDFNGSQRNYVKLKLYYEFDRRGLLEEVDSGMDGIRKWKVFRLREDEYGNPAYG